MILGAADGHEAEFARLADLLIGLRVPVRKPSFLKADEIDARPLKALRSVNRCDFDAAALGQPLRCRTRAREFPLTINYRCRPAIVDRANALIAAEPTASGRQMEADKSGGEVEVRVFDDVFDEALAKVAIVNRSLDLVRDSSKSTTFCARLASS